MQDILVETCITGASVEIRYALQHMHTVLLRFLLALSYNEVLAISCDIFHDCFTGTGLIITSTTKPVMYS